MAPTSAPSCVRVTAQVTRFPAAHAGACAAMNSSAAPSGYGCGTVSVLRATAASAR